MVSFVKFIARVFLVIFFRVDICGMENIPSKGAYILCSNHIAEIDMFLIGCRMKRLVHWMAKEELFKIPLIGSIIKRLGAFPIKRGKGDVDSIKYALKLLGEGKIIGMFPQGTRTKGNDEKKFKAKRGIIAIAQMADVPIIPVGIKGRYKLFGKIRVTFGKPFKLQLEKDKKYTNEETTQMASEVMDRVYKLVEG